jgi:hypothetical protein
MMAWYDSKHIRDAVIYNCNVYVSQLSELMCILINSQNKLSTQNITTNSVLNSISYAIKTKNPSP